jgi:hypothetical protein
MVLMMDARSGQADAIYELVSSHVCSTTGEAPEARVTLRANGVEKTVTAIGGGPVDAVFKCIESVVGESANLTLYSVNNITSVYPPHGQTLMFINVAGAHCHVAEDILKPRSLATGLEASAATHSSNRVIFFALIRVIEHVISFGNVLEPGFGLIVARVSVRVKLLG